MEIDFKILAYKSLEQCSSFTQMCEVQFLLDKVFWIMLLKKSCPKV